MGYFLPIFATMSVLNFQNHAKHEHQPINQHTAREGLAQFFDIKDKDLNEKCDKFDTDEKARWEKIVQATKDLRDAMKAKREDPKKWEKLNDHDKYKAPKNLIKTALPCAKEAKLNEKFEFYKQRKGIKKNV